MEKENQGEYLSIGDFAKLAGVTPQAVYQRKDRPKIKPFIKQEDGRTVISVNALELFAKEPQKEENNSLESVNKEFINSLKSQIEFLTAELDSKNAQISELHRILHMEQQMNQDARAALDAAKEKQLLLEAHVVELETEQQQEETKEEAQEPQHRPWFYKIFGGKQNV